MIMGNKYKLAFLLLLTGGVAATGAYAHSPQNPEAVSNMGKLSGAANLVMRGTVTSVEYRMSGPGENGSKGIPYAFVTYSVGKVLQGASPGKTLTMRFIGGTDGQGGFVEAEGVPKFEAGDEDILFVVGNGMVGCPLVMCEFGRFRVLDNAVYEAHGKPVLSVKGSKIVADGPAATAFQSFSYPAPTFDQLVKRPEVAAKIRASGLTFEQARAKYLAEAPKTIELTEADPAGSTKAQQSGMNVDAFMSAVAANVSASKPAAAAVASAVTAGPIAVPAAVGSAPPSAPRSIPGEVSPGDQIIKK